MDVNKIALLDEETLSTLSHTELEKLILTLQAKLSPPPNDWHSLFYALLMIMLYDKPSVKVNREVLLGVQPPRADFIVLKKDGTIDLGLRVFDIFKKHNIIEFKSPNDTLSESVLWKVIGYAGFYISQGKISAEDVTLTLFRGAKPVKLLKEMSEYIVPDVTKGIYHIQKWKVNLPIQIIVTTELEGREYAGFRSLSKKPRIEDIEQIVSNGSTERNPNLLVWYRSFLDLFSKLDNDVIEEAKRRFPSMSKTWWEIFEFDKEFEKQFEERRLSDLFSYVQEGGMTIGFAAKKANLSPEEFVDSMEKAGFKVPQSMA